nr:hypothetical protein WG33_0210 [uncultured bacterium]
MATQAQQNNSIGFLGALFLVFLVLKLTKVIDWSWWWITAPFWGPLAFVAVLLIFAGACYGLVALMEQWERRKTR